MDMNWIPFWSLDFIQVIWENIWKVDGHELTFFLRIILRSLKGQSIESKFSLIIRSSQTWILQINSLKSIPQFVWPPPARISIQHDINSKKVAFQFIMFSWTRRYFWLMSVSPFLDVFDPQPPSEKLHGTALSSSSLTSRRQTPAVDVAREHGAASIGTIWMLDRAPPFASKSWRKSTSPRNGG